MTREPTYTDWLSDEPLNIIRAALCETDVTSLTTRRARTLWNALSGASTSTCGIAKGDEPKDPAQALPDGEVGR